MRNSRGSPARASAAAHQSAAVGIGPSGRSSAESRPPRGAAAARPEVGTKVAGQGVDRPFEGTFEPVPPYLVTEKTHQAARWSWGSFMLGGLHGKSLCGREPFTTVYFYSIIDVPRTGYYRVDLVDYQLGGPCSSSRAGGSCAATTSSPLRVSATGGDVDLWIVMLVGQGVPPEATVIGTGLDGVLTVAGRKVRFDAQANRVRAGD